MLAQINFLRNAMSEPVHIRRTSALLVALALFAWLLVAPATGHARQFNGQVAVKAAKAMTGYQYKPGSGHAAKPGPTSLRNPNEVSTKNKKLAALDDSGLVRYAYHRAGVDLGRGKLHDQMKRFRRLASKSEALPGDLVVQAVKSAKRWNYRAGDGTTWQVSDAALYAGGDSIIASARGKGVRASKLPSTKSLGFYRLSMIGVTVAGVPNGTLASDVPDTFDAEDAPATPGAAAAPVSGGGGLLVNGSFDRDGSASGWSRFEPGTNMAVIAGGAHEGPNYLRANIGTAGSGASVYQDIPVSLAPGQSVAATLWVRGEGGQAGRGALAVWGLHGGGNENAVTSFTTNGQWQRIDVTFTATVPHAAVRFQLYMYSAVQYALDAGRLSWQLLNNPGFDKDGSASSWSRMVAATNMAVIAGNARAGAHYLRANRGTAGPGAGSSIYQDVALATPAGHPLTAAVWVRSDDGQKGIGHLALWALGGGPNEGKQTKFIVTPQWQRVEVALTPAQAHSVLRLEVYLDSGIQYAIDSAELTTNTLPSSKVEAAIAAARTQIGKPYLLGATGPDRFDCSGLVVWAFQQVGISVIDRLGRTSYNMYDRAPAAGLAVPYSQRRRGDLVFWYDPSVRRVGHVAIYLGDNRILQASPRGVNESIVTSTSTFQLKTDYVVRLG